MNLTSITLTVTGARAWATVTGPLTSGMVGIPVTIKYDEAWEGLTKNLVCRCKPWDSDGGETRTILNVGESTVVAHEVMQADHYLYLGIEGFREDGTLVMPTTWARCLELIRQGATSDADPSADPELPIWNQLQAQIRQSTATEEQIAQIQACAQAASQAASNAEQSEKNAAVSASSTAYLTRQATEAQAAAETAAQRAEAAVESVKRINPETKTEAMTQPVGMDEDGRLWTAPTAGNGGGQEEDILLGTLPMTISESNCYLLSDTNATISTGEGAAQLVDFNVDVPYVGSTTHNGGAFEVLGKNTMTLSFANTAKNASVYVPIDWEEGKTYTIAAQIVDSSDDIIKAAGKYVTIKANYSGGSTAQAGLTSNAMVYKSFVPESDGLLITLPTDTAYTAGETYVTIVIYAYEGEHTELPSGTTFDIIAGEKYPTDGYMGATLSAVSGETVEVYQVNTSGAASETDSGGVIFFGDSILAYSDVADRYAARTGKPVLNCAVGGTRMSASRDSSNAYYPLDMANIADAIASGDFTAQLGSGVATAGFTTLASANIANYKAMVLEFGTNDFSAGVPFEGDDATSIAGAVRHILRTILTKYPNMRIVVLSTLQYVTLGTGTESGVPAHDDGTVWQMNEVIRDVCESDEFCVPWVDMYHAFGQNGITRNTLNSDGVHLTSPNGAKRYADILVGQLNGLGI